VSRRHRTQTDVAKGDETLHTPEVRGIEEVEATTLLSLDQAEGRGARPGEHSPRGPPSGMMIRVVLARRLEQVAGVYPAQADSTIRCQHRMVLQGRNFLRQLEDAGEMDACEASAIRFREKGSGNRAGQRNADLRRCRAGG